MGYDLTKFPEVVNEELICSICCGVLDQPVQTPACEHLFCEPCITTWLSNQQTCPIDRAAVTLACLKPIPRVLNNFLSRLNIYCDFAAHGCDKVFKLEEFKNHLKYCPYDPFKPIRCDRGCELHIHRHEFAVNIYKLKMLFT